MNKEGSVVQVAILLIIIAILGVALLNKGNLLGSGDADDTKIVEERQQDALLAGSGSGTLPDVQIETDTDMVGADGKVIVERGKTQALDLVKAYFAAMGQRNFTTACGYLAPAQCVPTNENSVFGFSTEYNKLREGYEFLSIKDFGIVSESGREVVCVKYAYTYKEDLNPKQVREILSYYIEPVPGNSDRIQIAARVCEKKYKDGTGERPCPVQAVQPYCQELMKG